MLAVAPCLAIVAIAHEPACAQDTTGTPAAKRATISILPVLGSAPETGVQYGATVLRQHRAGADSGTRVSQDQAYAIYTAHRQARGFLQTDRWSAGNTWRVRARLEYQHYPLPFYGIGDDTPESQEESYTASGPIVQLLVQRRVHGSWFAGGTARVQHTRVSDVEPARLIASGTIAGSAGGTVVVGQGFLARDTRDHAIAPMRGSFMQLTGSRAADAWGSDFSFSRLGVDARRYWLLGPGHVVAAQLLVDAMNGRAPFEELVLVGSDVSMRGYTRGRYRDAHGASAQVEYRSPYVHRFGGVLFAGAGSVSHSFASLGSVVLPTYGAGVRFMLDPANRTAIRVDYGMGRGSTGLYVAFGEAF